MSGGSGLKSPQKGKDGNKRLGSLNSGFLSQSSRPGGLRSSGSGDPSTSQPSTSQPDQPAANGQPPARKRFIPRIRSRPESKGPISASAGVSSAAGDHQFKELIKQAQSDRSWERGGARGRGSTPAAASAQTAPKVMLNAGSVGDPRAGPGTRAPGPSSGSSGGGGGRSADRSSAARSRLGTGAVKQEDVVCEEDEDADDDKPGGLAQPMLDYRQYYPTVLPMRPPGQEVREDQDLLDDSKPPDLAHLPEDEVNAAESLGLADKSSAQERIVLLQMPALLPSPAPPPAADAAAAKLRHLRREEAPPAPVALSLKDLPSGKIGKMLVYESGAVKLQLGDVLFEVSPGTEAAFRQDIAAVSAADQACVFLGGVLQRAVACPDIGHLLSDEEIVGLQTHGNGPGKRLVGDVDPANPMDVDVKPEEAS